LILLADDEPDIVLVTKTRIQLNGYDVVTASDGEAALVLIRETQPDLIVLDLKMPKLDGFQVCKIVKSDPALSQIPVLLFSASSTYALCLEKQCLQLGADGYIRKPFDVKELLGKIAGLIKQQATRQAGSKPQAAGNLQPAACSLGSELPLAACGLGSERTNA
jgi:CheY-like chemotaxis protein